MRLKKGAHALDTRFHAFEKGVHFFGKGFTFMKNTK